MLNIDFKLVDETPVSGFDLGHMSIETDEVSIDSKSGGGRHLMMLFVSISDLLSGLTHLFTSTTRAYEFIGTGSSFTLVFRKGARDVIDIKVKQKIVVSIPTIELIQAIYAASEAFWHKTKPLLEQNDAIIEDLDNALTEFKQLIVM